MRAILRDIPRGRGASERRRAGVIDFFIVGRSGNCADEGALGYNFVEAFTNRVIPSGVAEQDGFVHIKVKE